MVGNGSAHARDACTRACTTGETNGHRQFIQRAVQTRTFCMPSVFSAAVRKSIGFIITSTQDTRQLAAEAGRRRRDQTHPGQGWLLHGAWPRPLQSKATR
jgi:hypothetical protein